MTVTRTTNSDSVYYWGSSDSDIVEDFVFSPKGDPKPLNFRIGYARQSNLQVARRK